MAKSLPIYTFGSDRFYVDLEQWHFRQVDNPTNTISIDYLKEYQGFTLLQYDKRSKNVFIGGPKAFKAAGENVVEVRLPIPARLDYKKAQQLLQQFRNKVDKDLQRTKIKRNTHPSKGKRKKK